MNLVCDNTSKDNSKHLNFNTKVVVNFNSKCGLFISFINTNDLFNTANFSREFQLEGREV